MEIFLQVLGSIVLAVIVIVVGFYIYMRISLGKYFNAAMENKDMTPLLIHLNEETEPEWISKKKAVLMEKELLHLGFTPDKCYNVVEMDGMQLKSFFNPPFVAVFYTHPVAGLWVDIALKGTDGKDYTVSNAPMGGEIESMPESIKYWLKGKTVSELYEKIVKETTGIKPEIIAAADFREYFEDAYKKEIQWKNKNGGIGFEEFLNVVKNDSKKYNEKEIKEAFTETKRKELMKWHYGALEEYVKKENIAEDDCYDATDNLLIVPSKTDAAGFIRYLSDIYYLSDEKQIKKLEEKYSKSNIEIKALFREINEGFSSGLRAIKKLDVTYPIDIEIYQMPKEQLCRY